LGLQGIVEHFGGELGQLPYPMHGKPSNINLKRNGVKDLVFEGLPEKFSVARYHSLYAKRPLPECLIEVAHVSQGEDDGPAASNTGGEQNPDEPIIMAVQHKTLPIAAVQFHPESILTSPDLGLQILSNVLSNLTHT